MNKLKYLSDCKIPDAGIMQLKLLEAPVSSELADFVGMTREIVDRYPEILRRVASDQINHGLAKKQIRLADKRFLESLTQDLPDFNVDAIENIPEDPTESKLNDGRPRMPALLLVVFFFLRGWLGGPKSDRTRLFVSESHTLTQLYEELQVDPPGLSTINDNLNTLSQETCDFCLRCQLAIARDEELDDFENVRIDSTAIHANAVYPTESVLIKDFLNRALAGFATLLKLRFHDFTERAAFKESIDLVKKVSTFSQVINMVSGKIGAKEKREANYKKIYSRVPRVAKRILPLVKRSQDMLSKLTLVPSKRNQINRVIAQIENDISSASQIAKYSQQRIVVGEIIAIDNKILSICEKSATIIKKGDRDLVFGYRPQLAFSGTGLAIAAHVPEGNAADSGQLQYMLELAEKNTGRIARIVTVDDGYLNGKVRTLYLERASEIGIEAIFSVAGSKGKRSLGEEVFYSDDYREARCDRSAVESCISTLKGSYGYDEVKRRGIESVRQEQMSKILAYNTRKLLALRREKIDRERAWLQKADTETEAFAGPMAA